MSPVAEPTTVTAPGLTIVPARLLEGGEIVILAVKPSGWFCLLASLPVLSVALLLAAIGYFTRDLPVPREAVYLICAVAAAVRLAIAYFQWMGRLYVLTSHRLIGVRGVLREDIACCPLKAVTGVRMSATAIERLLAVGNIIFQTDRQFPMHDWVSVSHPNEVLAIINDTLRRAG